MKRIVHIMTSLTLLFLFAFTSFVFICTENMNFKSGKTEIEIVNDYNFSYSEYLKRIEKACEESAADVMFSYLEYEDNSDKEKELVIFSTANSEEFFPFGTKNLDLSVKNAYSTDTRLISDEFSKNELVFVNFFYDYTVYPLSAMTVEQKKKCECLADTESIQKLSESLSEQKLSLRQGITTYNSDNSLFGVLYIGIAVMLFLTLLSMIFNQLSRARDIAVKRLDGYSFGEIIADILRKFFIIYLPEVCICLSALTIFFILTGGTGLFSFYLEKNIRTVFSVLIFIPILYILSCLNVFFLNPLKVLKGLDRKNLLYALTAVSKLVIMVVILTLCSSNISSLKSYVNNMKAYQNLSSKLENYYTISNTKFITGELDESYKKFYKLTHYTNEAIMMQAMSCSRPNSRDDISRYVVINDNYMKFNPIHDPNGNVINYENFKNDKAVILIPDGIFSESDVLRSYKGMFENVDKDEIAIYKYDKDQKFYIFEIIRNEYPGYVMHPIVIIHNDKYSVSGAIANGEVIFKAHTDNFKLEITPVLRDCNIDWATGQTPSVGSVYTKYINSVRFEIIVYSAVMAVFIFLLVCVITYESYIYCRYNRKKFTILKMNGYKFSEIHKSQIFLRIIFYVIIFVVSDRMNLNIIFPSTIIATDYIMFYGILESKISEYSSKILKGG